MIKLHMEHKSVKPVRYSIYNLFIINVEVQENYEEHIFTLCCFYGNLEWHMCFSW